MLRIQARDGELFFLYQRATPEDLRIQLSRALGVIRQAQAHAAPAHGSIGDELGRLAALADHGVLTREEFDQLKAKLIAER